MKLYRRKDSPIYWVTYSINGKRFRDSTGTANKRQAEAVKAKLEVEIFEGRHFPDKKRTDLTMAELRDMWLEHAKHKRSLKNDVTRFNTIIEHFGRNCLVPTLKKFDIERFRDALAERITRRGTKMRPATVNRHLALLRSALRHVEDEHLHRNPIRGVKFMVERNKRERECEPHEFEQLIEQAEPDLRMAIVIAHEAGLRRSEVCRALRSHYNASRRTLYIPASKTLSSRTVPLTRKAISEIKSAPVNMDGRLTGITPDGITRGFSILREELGIVGLIFHDLRGTAITRLARQGANLAELQKFSGHKSVQALMKYLKRGDKRLRELVDQIEAAEDA